MSKKTSDNIPYDLKPKQLEALDLLVTSAMPQTEVADKLGVSERTLYRWIHHNEEFRRAYDDMRKNIYRSIAPRAVRKIIHLMEKASKQEVQLKAAEKLLSLVGDDVQKVEHSGIVPLEIKVDYGE